MASLSADTIISKIENLRGQSMTEEERSEVHLWKKGRALAHIVVFDGWQVVLEMLRSYYEDSCERLSGIDPAKRDEVLAEQAVMYSCKRIYNLFLEDVARAIATSASTPAVVKAGAELVGQVPPDSL